MGTKYSRQFKKPKKKKKGKKGNGNGNSQDANLRRDGEADLMMRMFGLTASRVSGNPHKIIYFRFDKAAQILGVGTLDAKAAFDQMVGMGALEKANAGAYMATPRFDKIYASYQAEQAARKRA